MITFRNSAAFGRRIEYFLIGQMLHEGLDVYVPLVDDFGIDAVIRKADNTFIEVQIKARSKNAKHVATFAGLTHPEERGNYYFVFYSEVLGKMWILSSAEFIAETRPNKSGENAGKRTLKLHGSRNGQPCCAPRYDKYLADDFQRFRDVTGLVLQPDTNDADDAAAETPDVEA